MNPPAVKGTPEQRADLRKQRREGNQASYLAARAAQAKTGRELVIVACNGALAMSKRINDAGRRELARLVIAALDAVNTPQFRKDAS